MDSKKLNYIRNEITFFVPKCRLLGNKDKKSCKICSWAEKNGFEVSFSDAPFSGRWFKLWLLLKDSKSRKFSKVIGDIDKCCDKCR